MSDLQEEQPQRSETPTERADRNWNELLQELRVTQTGIQILSGFLLTLPFQQRFTVLNEHQRWLFLFAVVSSILATGLMVAPVSSHRILFRQHEKAALVTLSDRLAKAGLCALAVTVLSVLTLIFWVVLGTSPAVVATVVAGMFFLTMWLIVPSWLLRRRRKQRAGDRETGDEP